MIETGFVKTTVMVNNRILDHLVYARRQRAITIGHDAHIVVANVTAAHRDVVGLINANGGTSVTLRFCDIYSSLTGHNIKSRAHYTRIEYCYIHDSANRELDLVDAKDTERPGSHAILLGNILVKNPNSKGNRAVIHFGQDGGKDHNGTVYLIYNTIVTPFISPVVDLSAKNAKAVFIGNIVSGRGQGQNGQVLVNARGGATLQGVIGSHNWFGRGFASLDKLSLDLGTCTLSRKRKLRLFKDLAAHDYSLVGKQDGVSGAGLAVKKLSLPPLPGLGKRQKSSPPLTWQYQHPAKRQKRKRQSRPDLGACSSVK